MPFERPRPFAARAFARLPLVTLAALAAGVVPLVWAATASAGAPQILIGLGDNSLDQINGQIPSTLLSTPVVAVDNSEAVVQADGNLFGSVAVHADGSVWAWGNAITLGDGSTGTRVTPGRVPGLPAIRQVATTFQHVVALATDGTVWAWGDASLGDLGPNADASASTPSLPVKVPITGVVQVAAGHHWSMALKSNGEVWGWGDNSFLQLGQGSSVSSSATPARIVMPYGIVQVAAGWFHGVALRSDGSVWAWGDNSNGQLGNGVAGNPSATAVRVDRHVAGVTRIASGLFHSMALDSTGALWAWGEGTEGELGDGKGTDEATPIKVPLQAPPTLFDGGHQSSVAVLSDGTVWTWGTPIGQFVSSTTHDLSPIQLTGAGGITELTLEDNTLLALTTFVAVPDLQFSDLGAAEGFVDQAGLTVGSIDELEGFECQFSGTVVDQDPPAGALVPPGTAVAITAVDPANCL
jgi:alpha-tubulin suppressor-like RCC1 family protein